MFGIIFGEKFILKVQYGKALLMKNVKTNYIYPKIETK